MPDHSPKTEKARLILAFAAVYLIWGSTYLAIRIAIETLPPFLMAGTRFILAGGILYIWQRLRGTVRPTRLNWRSAAIIGGLMLLGGNGGVTWAEQTVPSGLAALMIATVPLWMVLIDWLRPGGVRPGRSVFAGLALGFAGMVILMGSGDLTGERGVSLVGGVVLVLASLSWSLGSLYSRSAVLPASPLMATAIEMLAGGMLLILLGTFSGEWAGLEVAGFSAHSLIALAYLVIVGAMIGFNAYIYLLRHTTPARAATYAYVNPVVAVFLGWAIGNEPLTLRMLIAAAVIIAGVIITTMHQARPNQSSPHQAAPTPEQV
nr:drug/metabolite exporter YedA [Anaerolineae bacterium]